MKIRDVIKEVEKTYFELDESLRSPPMQALHETIKAVLLDLTNEELLSLFDEKKYAVLLDQKMIGMYGDNVSEILAEAVGNYLERVIQKKHGL